MTEEKEYEHKLIIAKDAYVDIRVGNVICPVRLQGYLANGSCSRFEWISHFKERFGQNPEDLYISKDEFDALMRIGVSVEETLLGINEEDINLLIKSLKTSPENQKIEDEHQENLQSCDPFSIKINGQTITFEVIKPSDGDFEIKYKIDETPSRSFSEFNNKNITAEGNSLSRKEILEDFAKNVKDATFGELSPIEFQIQITSNHTWNEWYDRCQLTFDQLEDITDLYDLNEILQFAEKTNYTFWEFEGNQAYPQEYLPKEEHFSSDFR